MPLSRKKFIQQSALALAGVPFGFSGLGKSGDSFDVKNSGKGNVDGKCSVNIFSKHLHWLNYADMAKLVAELGFDGIDLTVRAGGHVLPERVADDLPKAVEIIKAAGLQVSAITTDIRTADEPHTEGILKTMAALSIKNYRMGWYGYDDKKGVLTDLKSISQRMAGLAAINKQYGVHGDYENHAGRFAGSLWDLWTVLKDLDPQWLGCQFDIRHATLDGAEAWPVNFRLLQPYIKTITIKDFYWEKQGDKWVPKDVPLGEGMVDFAGYFKLLKKYNMHPPISLHIEYPLGGAQNGATKLTIPKEQAVAAIRKDLALLKTWLKENDL